MSSLLGRRFDRASFRDPAFVSEETLFDPITSVSGVYGYWSADTLTYADGTSIGTSNPWVAKEGFYGNLISVSGQTNPTFKTNIKNRLPIVRFSATTDAIETAAFVFASDLIGFIWVFKNSNSSISNNLNLAGANNGNVVVSYGSSSPNPINVYDGTTLNSGVNWDNNWHILMVEFNSGSSGSAQYRLDGGAITTISGNAGTNSCNVPLRLGLLSTFNSPLQDIAAFVAFPSTAINSDKLNSWYNYLNKKWAVY